MYLKEVWKGVFGSFMGVSRKFPKSFKKVSRVFQENFNGISRKIKGCFNGVLSGFQRCLKEVQWVFAESFKGVWMMFQGSFKVVTWKVEGCSWRPRKLQWYFKKVSSVFLENSIEKFQGCFKNVSMNFCFAVLFLHVSHRSYPSRRRVCFLWLPIDNYLGLS